MQPTDYAKALGVAIAALAITLAASFPMVAFYAYFIEPGHPQEFYNEAAQWIAPWSSYILGPICFFGFNYWLARRSPSRNATLFAAMTIVSYAIIDLSMLPMMGIPLAVALNPMMGISIGSKAIAAFLGAYLGSRHSAAAPLAS